MMLPEDFASSISAFADECCNATNSKPRLCLDRCGKIGGNGSGGGGGVGGEMVESGDSSGGIGRMPVCKGSQFRFKGGDSTYGYVSTAIGAIGMILNILTIIVLVRQKDEGNRSTPRIIMIALALSDTLEIVSLGQGNIQYFIPDKRHPYNQWILVHHWWIYPLQLASTTFNRGLMLFMTFERWSVICRPLTSIKKFQEKRRLFLSFLVLTVWSLALNLPRVWEYKVEPNCCILGEDDDDRDRVNKASSTAGVEYVYRLVSRPEYSCNAYYAWGYKIIISLGLNFLVPFLIMIALNGMAIYVLMKSRDALRHSISGGRQQPSGLSRMCVAVVAVYTVLQLPYLIQSFNGIQLDLQRCRMEECNRLKCESFPSSLLEPFFSSCSSSSSSCGSHCANKWRTHTFMTDSCFRVCHARYPRGSRQPWTKPFTVLRRTMLVLSCCVNFFVYMAFGRNFREAFLALICPCVKSGVSSSSRSMTYANTASTGVRHGTVMAVGNGGGEGGGDGGSGGGGSRLRGSTNKGALYFNPGITKTTNNLPDSEEKETEVVYL